jgi:hypothetical protein
VIVTELEPPAGPGDSNPNNEFVVDSALRVNDFLILANPFPSLNTVYASISGVLDYRNGYSKLEPRSQVDLVVGAPVLVSFAPALSYAREGTMSAPTIPTPLTVALSGPAQSSTFVSIGSASPASLAVAGGGVTIPQGQQTAPVLVDALQQALSVNLTATLGSNMITSAVRVVGSGEQPQVAFVDPPASSVAPSGMTALTVFLDIPALNPGGNSVALSLSPNMYGTIPSNVLVPADQIAATFNFTAGTMTGSETITALLNAGMASAIVDVSVGGALVINELDYDNQGTDLDEFVEILNTSSATVSLSGLSLVLINGNNNTEYNRIDLGPAGSLMAGEYLVLGSTTALMNVPVGVKTLAFAGAQDQIQNGAPDAIGIIDLGMDMVLDVLSYEGSVNGVTVMGISGMVDFVEGTPATAVDINTGPGSLSRLPNGSDSDDADSDWAFTTTGTPGTANVP